MTASTMDRAGPATVPWDRGQPRNPVAAQAPPAVQFVRFTGLGIASTVATLLCYLGLRTVIDVQAANVISTVVVGLANAIAN